MSFLNYHILNKYEWGVFLTTQFYTNNPIPMRSRTTTPNGSPMTTPQSRRIFSIDSCSDATWFTIVPWQIPLENNQTAFPFELWKYLYKFWKYIIKLYLQNTVLNYEILFKLLYKIQVDEWHHWYPLLVQSACSVPPLHHLSSLNKICISSAGVPSLRSIKWPGRVRPCKNEAKEVTLSQAHKW